jgi:lysophospholipase L1-like esterase
MNMKNLNRTFLAIILLGAGFMPALAQNNNGNQPPAMTQEQRDAFRKAMEDQRRNDWANLTRYKQDNTNIGLPAKGENRVVFMGNSITDFWIRFSPEFFKGKPYVDRGISGQTTPQMLVRFRQDVINLKPSVVVLLAGINDINGNTGPSTLEMIEDNIASMTEVALANNIKVVLSSVLPCDSIYRSPDLHPRDKVVELNKWIMKYAGEKNCVYLDYFSNLTNGKDGLRKDLTNDGLHPNKAGYQVMEPLAEAAIKKALGK